MSYEEGEIIGRLVSRLREKRKKKGMERSKLNYSTPFVHSRSPPIKDNCINLFPIRRRNSRSFGLITLLNDPAPPASSGLRLSIKFLGESKEPATVFFLSFFGSLAL